MYYFFVRQAISYDQTNIVQSDSLYGMKNSHKNNKAYTIVSTYIYIMSIILYAIFYSHARIFQC